MVILHIANIDDNLFSGVSVVVPQHVLAQSAYATVALININNNRISSLDSDAINGNSNSFQISYATPFDLNAIAEPFDKPDLVVFHECYCLSYPKIALHLRRHNIPYVICPHGELRAEALSNKWLKKKLANALLFNSFINKAVGIQCLSSMEMLSIPFSVKKFVASNGINMPNNKKSEFSDSRVKFIYIGRYDWKVKGLDLLFDAISSIKPYLLDHNCVFELYGPDGKLGWIDQVKSLVSERSIDDIVFIHSEISGSEKERALLDSDIFIQTSRHEGMPMGILEALSYGLPCLVSEGTSLGKDIVKYEAGWCSDNSSESIAETIVEAVEDRARWNQISVSCINYILKEHLWDIEAKRAINYYGNLISTGNAI